MGAILPGPERDRAREAELMAELFGGIARERRGLDDEPPEEAEPSHPRDTGILQGRKEWRSGERGATWRPM